MGKLEVPEGYESFKKDFIRKLRKGEVVDLEAPKKDLFYIA